MEWSCDISSIITNDLRLLVNAEWKANSTGCDFSAGQNVFVTVTSKWFHASLTALLSLFI
jgi:hypothetical protein